VSSAPKQQLRAVARERATYLQQIGGLGRRVGNFVLDLEDVLIDLLLGVVEVREGSVGLNHGKQVRPSQRQMESACLVLDLLVGIAQLDARSLAVGAGERLVDGCARTGRSVCSRKY
jgi:hypothetical protein